jgi:hypothetical protein
LATPRFLADEDLRHPIVKAVRRREPALEFATVVDLGLSGSTDAAVLEFATANGWLVVSHDVNTMKASAELRVAAGAGLSGLFWFRNSDQPDSWPTTPSWFGLRPRWRNGTVASFICRFEASPSTESFR